MNDLATRLEENASRTKNTIQIIQTKIKTGAIDSNLTEVSIRAAMQEALNSGFADVLHSRTNIQIQGSDFLIRAEQSIVHVFINIIKNAVEALSATDNPTIIIDIDADSRAIKIVDNGPGIASETISRIFDENFTTKKNGAGKGLYFCKLLIEEFDGILSCSSCPGHTVFLMDFSANKMKDGT